MLAVRLHKPAIELRITLQRFFPCPTCAFDQVAWRTLPSILRCRNSAKGRWCRHLIVRRDNLSLTPESFTLSCSSASVVACGISVGVARLFVVFGDPT
jgi:hypothetical protein